MIHRIAAGILLLLVGSSINVLAQPANDYGIVLHGETSVRPIPEYEGDTFKVWNIRLSLVYENAGKEPAILINPTLGYGDGLRKIDFFFSESMPWKTKAKDDLNSPDFGHIGNTQEFPLSSVENESLAAIVRFLDDIEPPENYTFVLRPGETRRFEHEFNVRQRFSKVVVYPSTTFKHSDGHVSTSPAVYDRKWDDSPNFCYPRDLGCPLDRSRYFRLTFEFSFLPVAADPDFLEKLANRWRRFGRLPVGTNGTYLLKTEPILFVDKDGRNIGQ